MNRNIIRLVVVGLVGAFWCHCSSGPRPSELLKADELVLDQTSMVRAMKAAPDHAKASQKYHKLAEEAFESGDKDECVYYSTLAAVKFSTALEIAKRQDAEKRLKEATKRLKIAQKEKESNEKIQADATKRIARMEKIMELQKSTTHLEARQEISGHLASAKSNIQAAEALDAAKHDSVNLNSAKTFVVQAEKALEEKRFKDASDLAKMAVDKAVLATANAKKLFAREKKATDLLKEREQLFSEANNIHGLIAKQEKRGVVLTLYDLFAGGKVRVLPERTYLLDKIGALAKKYPDYPLMIEGYTDSWGKDATNLVLSQGRAQAVLDYLVQNQQVDFNQIRASGYGEANPIADNSTHAGRAKNRRVEVIFLFR